MLSVIIFVVTFVVGVSAGMVLASLFAANGDDE